MSRVDKIVLLRALVIEKKKLTVNEVHDHTGWTDPTVRSVFKDMVRVYDDLKHKGPYLSYKPRKSKKKKGFDKDDLARYK